MKFIILRCVHPHTNATRTCLHFPLTCSPGFASCKWVCATMTCVELHHATGDEFGIAQRSCELGFNSCTRIPSGTLSILTCGQKKHAIEVLGRILTAVVFLHCMLTTKCGCVFYRFHLCRRKIQVGSMLKSRKFPFEWWYFRRYN